MIDLSHGWSFKTLSSPPIDYPGYSKWQQRHHCVFNWVISNLEAELVNEVSQYAMAIDLWDGLAVTYGSGSDPFQIYDLHRQAMTIKQGNMTLEALWNKFRDLWISIDTRDPNPMSYPTEIEKYNKREQMHRLYQFLSALDEKYVGIKREIMDKDLLPTVRRAYGMVRRQAINDGVLGPPEPPNSGIGSGLAATDQNRTPPQPNHSPHTSNRTWNKRKGEEDKSKLTCSHCGGKKRTRDGCFLLIGYPEWWDEMKKARAARNRGQGGRAAIAVSDQPWNHGGQAA